MNSDLWKYSVSDHAHSASFELGMFKAERPLWLIREHWISTLLLLTTLVCICDSNRAAKLIWLFVYIKGNLYSFESKGIAIIGSKSLQAYSAICTIQHSHPYLVVLLTWCFTASEKKKKKKHQRTTDTLIQAKYFESHSISQYNYLICSNDFLSYWELLSSNLLYGKYIQRFSLQWL